MSVASSPDAGQRQPPHQVDFAIIGAGFSGLGAAIRLKQAGYSDLVILERADDVGGTWRDNTYPGCRCDVQSSLYSYSFAPKPDWSETYPSQPELWDYLRMVSQDLRAAALPAVRARGTPGQLARLGQALAGDHDRRATSAARYLIAGVGFLVEPSLPDIPGIETFSGELMHSARWDGSAGSPMAAGSRSSAPARRRFRSSRRSSPPSST